MIDGESGAQLWAETFDEDRVDLLQMEDEIVARIMNGLIVRAVEIEAERASRRAPGSPMALALRCGARAAAYSAETVDPEKGAEVFKTCDEALRLDPHNPIALSVRAAWLLDGVDRAQSADREGDLSRAEKDVTTLLAVNPNDPFAHALKVFLLRLEGRPEQAIAEGEQIVALNPGHVQAYYYLCPAYTDAKQPEKAIDCVDKAVRLSPHDPALYGLLMTKAGALETLGREEEALDWVRRSLALSPANPIALRHGIALLEILGRDDEAKEAYRRYSALPGPQVSTIAELRACAAVPSCAASERNIEALRKAGMPEQ